jgi:adenine deaminase
LIDEGYNIYDVIRSVTVNPVSHYNLDAGLLRPGDNADFIIVDSPWKMNILETWINGEKVYDRGKVLFEYFPGVPINNFNSSMISQEEITVERGGNEMRVITAFDGELFTKETIHGAGKERVVNCDMANDILKIIVKDRYKDLPPSVGFIKGFGLKFGAFASSVAHDSHNIISIGTNDEDIVNVVNEIIKMKGGLAVSSNGRINSLQLNIAGIMSTRPCREIAREYKDLSSIVKQLGCTMAAPFMTLSFMALLVIPELKIFDKGLFDGKRFRQVPHQHESSGRRSNPHYFLYL